MENNYKEYLVTEKRKRLEKVALKILEAKLSRGDCNVDLREVIRYANKFIEAIDKEEI